MHVEVNEPDYGFLLNFQSLAEAEEKTTNLLDQIKTLRGSVEQLQGQLNQSHRMCEEKTNVSEKKP